MLEQQVSLRSAATLFRRLDRTLRGGIAVQPILRTKRSGLRALGPTRQQSDYLVSLAEEIESGRLDLRGLHRLTDAGAHAALTRVRGIGPWTAGIHLLLVLRRPDVWRPGDLALHVALGRLRGQNRVPRLQRPRAHAVP